MADRAISDDFLAAPLNGLSFAGPEGGPFKPSSTTYTLWNTGGTHISWEAAHGENWVSLSSQGGTLQAGQRVTITVSINGNADSLPRGGHHDTLLFSDTSNDVEITRTVKLHVGRLQPGILLLLSKAPK
jgi:hypothetical protein